MVPGVGAGRDVQQVGMPRPEFHVDRGPGERAGPERPVVGFLRGRGGQLDPEDRARHELAEVARVDRPAEDRGDLLVDPGALPEQRGQGGKVIQRAFVRHLVVPG